MIILSIETSCDDTGVAVLDIKKGGMKIIADFVSSQNEVHSPYGGVVPNLAVRAHYKNLPILLERVLGKIDVKKIRTGSLRSPNLVSSLRSEIDLIAVTIGPGLEPCLWAGVNTARMLAQAIKKPIVGVNHLEGHIAANFIGGMTNDQTPMTKKIPNSKSKILNPESIFPAICLIVSGGHTQLVLMKNMAARGEPRLWRGKYKVIGQTRDDAAGEAFDKAAKLLGLGYPGGPQIALKAKKGDAKAFNLPRPMIGSKDFDFSFSGLKTAVLYLLRDMDSRWSLPRSGIRGGNDRVVNDLCASFQQAAIDVLVDKTIKAAKEYKAKSVMLSGGVAANQELRKQLGAVIKNCLPTTDYRLPPLKYCTDNAVMIGLAGYWKFMREGEDKIENVVAKANLQL